MLKSLFFGFVFTMLATSPPLAQTQTVTQPPEYQGFRIFVAKIVVEKTKPAFTQVQLTIINTGREAVLLKPGLEDKLVIKYDPSFKQITAQIDSLDFLSAIFNSGISLSPGEVVMEQSIKVVPTPVRLEATQAELAMNQPVALPVTKEETQNIEQVADAVEVDIPDESNTANQDNTTPSKKGKLRKAKEETENIEQVVEAVELDIPDESKTANQDNTTPSKKGKLKKAKEEAQNIEQVAEAVEVDIPDESITGNQENTTSSKKVKIKKPKKEKAAVAELTQEVEGCSDLVLEELFIVKQNKSSVQLAYTLRNVGVGSVNIKGQRSEEGLAIRGHLSSSPALSRGALPVGGKFVKAPDEEAVLLPGTAYEGILKLPLHKLTKFTPYLILQVDPYQMIIECDETNNLQFINLLPDSPLSNN